MSSFRDIALNIINGDTLLGRSMYSVNHEAHEKLERQMRELERKNTVTVVPMGASAEHKDQKYAAAGSIGGKIAAQSSRANEKVKRAAIVERKKRNKAGHQNLIARTNNKFTVLINDVCLGLFEKDEALRVRDSYRIKNNLPVAEY